jgi:hypothetical protein
MKKVLAFVYLYVFCQLSAGENIEYIDGSVLTNAQVILQNPSELFVSYQEQGKVITRNIPFSALSERMRQKYKYNSKESADYKTKQTLREENYNKVQAEETLRRTKESIQKVKQGNKQTPLVSMNSKPKSVPRENLNVIDPLVRSEHWQEIQFDHFRVYHKGNTIIANKSGDYLENKFKDMMKRLNISIGLDIVWYGPNCVKFYIYPSQKELVADKNLPKWAAGYADYQNKTIYSIEDEDDIKGIVSHELGHILFFELMDKKPTIGWLDEGMAMWLESEESRDARQKALSSAKKTNSLMSLEELTSIHNYQSLNSSKANLFYGQSQILVDILIKAYDFTVFRSFCIQIQNKSDFTTAFNIFYSPKFGSLDGLKKAWLDSI